MAIEKKRYTFAPYEAFVEKQGHDRYELIDRQIIEMSPSFPTRKAHSR